MASAPENIRSDTRRAAESLLLPMLAGEDWLGTLKRDPAETRLPANQAIASRAKISHLLDLVKLEGTTRPWLPIPFKVTPLISGMHSALAVLANLVGEQRGLAPQSAVLDTDHATTSLAGHFAVEQNGLTYGKAYERDLAEMKKNPPKDVSPATMWYLWSQTYKCKDGRHIFLYQKWDTPTSLLETVGFPKSEIPSLLAKCDPIRATRADRESFVARLARHIETTWNSYDLEAHMIKTRVGAVIVPRSRKELNESPQGKEVGWRPPLEFYKHDVNGSKWAPKPFDKITDPSKGVLQGIKVVELTRALMGARMGTVLGYMGASDVKATSPYLEDFGMLSIAHNLGKLSIFLDLKKESDRETLKELIRGADVFIQNYAYGAVERLGFGPKDVFELVKDRPYGIIYVEANAFGFGGPYATAPGFEHLAQGMCGMAWGQGIEHQFHPQAKEFIPAVVPINVLDKATGHMGAIGAIIGLLRRAKEGGSWLVRGSLVQTGVFLQELGAYEGLETVDEKKWGVARKQGHWMHTEVWPRFPKEENPMDPDGYHFYLAYMMESFMRDCHPPCFSDKFFDYYEKAPFGDCKVLKPPLFRGFEKTPMRYRIPPRPIGFDDGIKDWKTAEKRTAEIEREMKCVDFEKVKAGAKL